jgi:hypothetical protein
MWVPILTNFLHSILVILGIFGVYQFRLNYLISYLVWSLIWMAWNGFVVCLYLRAGKLDPNSDLLSFGTGSYSWWVVNGFGCNAEYFPDNSTLELDESKLYLPVRPTKVTGCLIQYQYVEVIHAGIQLLLASLGFIFGVVFAHHLVTVVLPRRRKSGARCRFHENPFPPEGFRTKFYLHICNRYNFKPNLQIKGFRKTIFIFTELYTKYIFRYKFM